MHAYLAPYIGFGWESCFSIQECPHKRDGWSTSQIAINIESEEPFSVPNSLRPWYQSYFAENIVRRGFHQDGEKFMLLNNPIASSDAFRLELKVRPTLYSCAMFYADSIANSPRERDVLIRTFLKASLEARFAHRLCLHMIIVTKDRKILLTERSPKLAEAQGQWSASAEEQLTRDDFGEGPDSVVRLWARRLLSEELSIPEDFYHAESIRILTIFLEADYLNVSLCGYATLNVKADDLEKHLRGSPDFAMELRIRNLPTLASLNSAGMHSFRKSSVQSGRGTLAADIVSCMHS